MVALAGCLLCAVRAPAQAQTRDAANPGLTPPVPIYHPPAVYPPEAVGEGREATMVVLATVGADGVVKAVEIAESGGEALDHAALAAALKWRFKPALQVGRPIESQVRIPFRFHLAPPHAAPPPPTPTPTPTPMPTTPAGPSQPSALPVAPEARSPSYQSLVLGKREPPSRGASDYHVDIGALSLVPRKNASELLKLAPGILLTNEGGEAHAEQVFLRGFDAREGQDIEFTVDGVPINESGNLHGNGFADTHFLIPELITSLGVLEGPFDPRQGNYAVAGSADYQLGLLERGLTAKYSVGSFNTQRMLLTWGPQASGRDTFVGAELYHSNGFGQNRDGNRASVLAQYGGRAFGNSSLRLTAQAYIASFHSAGVLRQDDYQQRRVGFFDTYDPLQGEDASRYSVAAELETREGRLVVQNQIFGFFRPMRLRENFTGFLLDVQQPLEQPHGQRGDLLDLNVTEATVGARGSLRFGGLFRGLQQEIEVGYFARGDAVSASQRRIERATGHPYFLETDLDSKLGDIGIYGDLSLRPLGWLAVRGGVRGDLFTFDVLDKCAVHSVAHPSPVNPPGDRSCLDQQDFGRYREPVQQASTASGAYMPRGSVLLGPWWGLGASASAGTGVRSIDPNYISQDAKTPFASVTAYEGGLTFNRSFEQLGFELGLRSVVFYTRVDRDLIFAETAGRNILGGPTARIGSASSLRLNGSFYDLAANFTYVRAKFEDTGFLLPYVPDLVVRIDTSVFGDLPWAKLRPFGVPLRGALALGVTYVGPRPLPQDQRSDTILTIDANATLAWRWLEVGVSATNLLDRRYRLGEYNYASDFHSQSFPTLVPVRHFSAGAPRIILFSIAIHYGGRA